MAHAHRAIECHVYVDFDGTIAPDDPTDALFERFADPYWREIELEWQEGRLTSTECMSRQARLLRATPAQIEQFLASVKIDPAFPAFVRFCKRHGMKVSVVSDGFDLVVGSVLRAAGLDLPFFANALGWQGGDRWTLRFPHRRTDCRVGMGNCKCSHATFATRRINVMIGDGRSDFCIAERCDLVLSKGRLTEHCRQAALTHVPIASFAAAKVALATWLGIGDGPARVEAEQIAAR